MLRFAAAACGVVLALALTVRCAEAPAGGRILVVALDGLDPDTVDTLVGQGKLPTFARLRQQGAWGRLRSIPPLLSPVVWTTIATGRSSVDHHISDFTALDRATGGRVPVTSRMRRVKALWNIFSEQGRSTGVVGWWATWPAESIQGTLVSDRLCYHFLFEQGFQGGGDRTGLIHPASRFDELSHLVRRPVDVSGEEVAGFLDEAAPDAAGSFNFKDDLSHFRWALATARTYSDIGLRLWETDAPDLLMVYIEAVDTVSHLYGHLFRAGVLSGDLEAQRRRFGHTVERTYQYADRLVGRFVEKLDDRTTLVVLSDHGFSLGALPDDPSHLRDMRRVSAANHKLDGTLVLYGRAVRPGARTAGAGILDVAPTLLALAGLPPSEQMPGRVLEEAIVTKAPARIASYEGASSPEPDESGSSVDAEILEKLRSLGYVGADSPRGDRTMATMLFEAKRYEEAIAAYEGLLEDHPDDPGLLAGLGAALGALGRHGEARRSLERAVQIAPLMPEGHHNLAVLLERQGDRKAALREYQLAVRYAPAYEPSRQALERLSEDAEPTGPHPTPARQLALLMAARASESARRGDYAAAMRTLDEAERIAPDLALLYQYRSNVAYLMGDKPAAIAALEAGLRLEPDNALFKENLRRLRSRKR